MVGGLRSTFPNFFKRILGLQVSGACLVDEPHLYSIANRADILTIFQSIFRFRFSMSACSDDVQDVPLQGMSRW